jgi:hypothetical protein
MEHTIVNQMDEEYLEFLSNLRKLSKDEIVDLISNYWITLKRQAESDISKEGVYMSVETGNTKLTQVNRLKILVYGNSKDIYFHMFLGSNNK